MFIKVYWCRFQNRYFTEPNCEDMYHKRDSRLLTISMIIVLMLNWMNLMASKPPYRED